VGPPAGGRAPRLADHSRQIGVAASVGGLSNLSRGGITNFFDGPGDEPFDILNEAVVPFAEALKVAQEFAVSKEMPKCIPWNSLILGE
jgi:hypothetical protein